MSLLVECHKLYKSFLIFQTIPDQALKAPSLASIKHMRKASMDGTEDKKEGGKKKAKEEGASKTKKEGVGKAMKRGMENRDEQETEKSPNDLVDETCHKKAKNADRRLRVKLTKTTSHVTKHVKAFLNGKAKPLNTDALFSSSLSSSSSSTTLPTLTIAATTPTTPSVTYQAIAPSSISATTTTQLPTLLPASSLVFLSPPSLLPGGTGLEPLALGSASQPSNPFSLQNISIVLNNSMTTANMPIQYPGTHLHTSRYQSF